MDSSSYFDSLVLEADAGYDFEQQILYAPQPIATGVKRLDSYLGGGIPGQGFTVIGGTPGVGKSMLAVFMAYHTASCGKPVVYVSMEMPRHQVKMRLFSLHSAMIANLEDGLIPFSWSSPQDSVKKTLGANVFEESRRFETSDEGDIYQYWARHIKMLESENPIWHAVKDFRESGIESRILIRDDISSLEQCVDLIADLESHGIRCLTIIDYAQLLETGESNDETERVTSISRALQKASMGMPVLLISSLRKVKDGLPSVDINSFRGSGYIGYDAVCAIILTRGGDADMDSEQVPIDVHVIKNRFGKSDPDSPIRIFADMAVNYLC